MIVPACGCGRHCSPCDRHYSYCEHAYAFSGSQLPFIGSLFVVLRGAVEAFTVSLIAAPLWLQKRLNRNDPKLSCHLSGSWGDSGTR